jgi:hypothetical protein
MEITVTFRDMYMSGTDTVSLTGNAARRYSEATDKSAFLCRLETVEFTAPYVISEKIK